MQFLLFWEEEFYDLTTLKDKNFALKLDKSLCPVITLVYFPPSAIAACAAAKRAIGTRNGEQET